MESPRSLEADFQYLCGADSHDGQLGERAARSCLEIALYWVVKAHEHDARVSGLLAANNTEVERRRAMANNPNAPVTLAHLKTLADRIYPRDNQSVEDHVLMNIAAALWGTVDDATKPKTPESF